MENTGLAGFGQATQTVFDALHLTAGVRFDHQDMDGKMNSPTMPKGFERKMDNDEWLPKFSIAYDFTEDAMAYVSAAKGFLAGGFNYGMARIPESFIYGSEYTWNYEAGIKVFRRDGKYSASAAVFHIEISDKQVFEVDAATFATQIRNAAEAHSTGFEVEFRARPATGLDIFGSLGWAEAKFDDWKAVEFNSTYTGLVTYDYEDKKLPNAPLYTGALGAMYRHGTGLFARADMFLTGEFYADAKNTARQGAYELVNCRAGYETDHFEATLWCKNLFDREYETIKYAWGVNELVVDGAGQSFGVLITLRR